MVTIQLSKPICNFAGTPIIVAGENREWLLKDLLLQYLGVHSSKERKNSFVTLDFGIRMQRCEDPEMVVENSEYLLLKEATQNPLRTQNGVAIHGDMVMSQLWKALDEAEATKTVPKKED